MSKETKTTVTIISQATKSLSKIGSDLVKATAALGELTTVSEGLADSIELRSVELENMKTEMATSLRDAKADLAIDVKENADSVLDGLMASRGLATITASDLSSLHARVNDDEYNNSVEIRQAVDAANTASAIACNAKISAAESKHKVETADIKAKNTTLEAQIEFLKSTISTLERSADAEREARVSIAASAVAPTISVGK